MIHKKANAPTLAIGGKRIKLYLFTPLIDWFFARKRARVSSVTRVEYKGGRAANSPTRD
ncbi:MAG: hypothetical protein ABIQ35_12110 [Verrucomicrobiota bacterium]